MSTTPLFAAMAMDHTMRRAVEMIALFGIMKWTPTTVRTPNSSRNRLRLFATGATAIAVLIGILWIMVARTESPIGPSGNDLVAAVDVEESQKDDLEAQKETLLAASEPMPSGPVSDRVQVRPAQAAVPNSTVTEFSRKYLGALSYRSSAQEEWALRNGFPSGQQVTEAALLSTAELAELAQDGESVYEALYFDRLLDEAIERASLVEQGGTDMDAYFRTEEGQALDVALLRQSWEVLQTDSPFAGYILFRYNDTFMKDKYGAFASLNLIAHRGDRRIYETLGNFARRNGISQDVIQYVGTFAGLVEIAEHGGSPDPDPIPMTTD